MNSLKNWKNNKNGVRYKVTFESVIWAVCKVKKISTSFTRNKNKKWKYTMPRTMAYALLRINYSRDEIADYFNLHRTTTYNMDEVHNDLLNSNQYYYADEFYMVIRWIVQTN